MLGDVHRDDAGVTLSAWGMQGLILKTDEAGDSAGEARLGSGGLPVTVGQVTELTGFYP